MYYFVLIITVSFKKIWLLGSQHISGVGLTKKAKVLKQWMGIATLTFGLEHQMDHAQ